MKRIFFVITILSLTFFYNCNSKLSKEEIKEKMTESYTQFLQDQGFKDIKLSFNEMDSATENTIDSLILRNLEWDFKCLSAPRTEEDIRFDSLFNLEEYNLDTLMRCKQAITDVTNRIKSRQSPKVYYMTSFLTTCNKSNGLTMEYIIQQYNVFFTTDSIKYVSRVPDYSMSRTDEY